MKNLTKTLWVCMLLFCGIQLQAQNCVNYDYFLSSFVGAQTGDSDIYGVSLNGSNAELTLLTTVAYDAQIAYAEDERLLYLLDSDNGVVTPYNPVANTFGTSVTFANITGRSPQFESKGGGIFYISDGTENKVYEADYNSGVATLIASLGINGGDLVFKGGVLYSANASGAAELLTIDVNNGTINVISSLPYTALTGAGLTDGGQLLLLGKGTTKIDLFNFNGTSAGVSYNLTLNGQSFLHDNGDLSGGCTDLPPANNACSSLKAYYIHQTQITNGVWESDFYELVLNGYSAELTLLLEDFAGAAHIALNTNTGNLTVVNSSTGLISEFDVTTNTITPLFQSFIDKATAITYDAANDRYYVGGGTANMIYSVDVNTETVTAVVSAPVDGGDLELLNGDLFLATKDGNRLIKLDLTNAANHVVLGTIDNSPAGFGALGDGTAIIQSVGQTAFKEVDAFGYTGDEYPASVNGQPFTLGYGDLATGCVNITTPPVGQCANFNYYMSSNVDQPNGERHSEIYAVTLDGNDANLVRIGYFQYATHLAYNEVEDLLYVIQAGNGPSEVTTYDPLTNSFDAPVSIAGLSYVVQAVFDNNGTLYVGCKNTNSPIGAIYEVDLVGLSATKLMDAPVNGGDLTFTNDGVLLMGTRNGDDLLSVNLLAGTTTKIADLSVRGISGLVTRPSGTLLSSNLGATVLTEYAANGNATGTVFNLKLNGAAYSHIAGDLTGGCNDATPVVACSNYLYYLSDNVPQPDGSSIGTVYQVNLIGNNARLTKLAELEVAVHLAFNPVDSKLYLIENNTNGTITVYDPLTGTFGASKNFPTIGEGSVQGAFDDSGRFIVGNSVKNKFFEVDFAAGTATQVATGTIFGGDLEFLANGSALSITGSATSVFNSVDLSTGTSTALGSVSASVTGMALTSDDKLLLSYKNNVKLFEYNTDGTATGKGYKLRLNGASFTTTNGDLTSGCVVGLVIAPGDCAHNPRARKVKITNNTGGDLLNVSLSSANPNNPSQVWTRNKAALKNGATWQFWFNAYTFNDTIDIEINGAAYGTYIVSDEPNICPAEEALVIDEVCSRKFNRFRWAITNTNNHPVFVWYQDTTNNNGIVDRIKRINPDTVDYVYTIWSDVDFSYQGLSGEVTLSVSAAAANPTICPVASPLFITSICSEKKNRYKWELTNPNDYGVQMRLIAGNGERWIWVPASSKGGVRQFYTHKNIGTTINLSYDFEDGIDLMAALNPDACDNTPDPECPLMQDVVRYEINTYENDGCIGGGTHSIWLPQLLNNSTTVMHFLNNSDYTSYLDVDNFSNTATLKGFAVVEAGAGSETGGISPYNFAGTVWEVEIEFAMGNHNPKFENDACGNQSGQLPNWKFFTLLPPASGHHLVRKTDNAGVAGAYGEDYIDLTHMYGNNNFGFQLGTSANGKNKSFGVSGWFHVASNIDPTGAATASLPEFNGTSHGDINADLTLICVGPDLIDDACARPNDGACYAADVYSYTEGTLKNGDALPQNRRQPNRALGEPEDNDTYNFVTLGYGGELILDFGGAISNGPGNDIKVVETSFGSPSCANYTEQAQVWVSQCGLVWYNLGTICQDGELELDSVGLEWVQYVKLINDGSNTTDGFDVDGVIALNNSCTNLSTLDPTCIAFANPFVHDINIDLGNNTTTYANIEWYIYEGIIPVQSGSFTNVTGTFTIAGIGPQLIPSSTNVAKQFILKIRVDGVWLKSIMLMKNW